MHKLIKSVILLIIPIYAKISKDIFFYNTILTIEFVKECKIEFTQTY